MNDIKSKKMRVKHNTVEDKFPLTEIFAAIVCNLGQYSCGLIVGWLSPAIPQMIANGLVKDFDQEYTLQIFSWMAAAFPLIAVFFTPLTALISEGLGRKTCSAVGAIPFAINALIIISTSNIYWTLFGRFIIGIGVALSAGNNQVFIGEAVRVKVRGKLGSLMALAYASGTLSAYIVGGFISYTAAGFLMLIVALANFSLFFFIPETPAWLVKNGKLEEAYKSVAWYRRTDVDDVCVQEEIKHLVDSTSVELPSRLQAMKQLIHSPAMRRGALICLFAIVCQGWCGMIAIHSYSVSIFMQSGAGTISPEGAAAIYGTLQVLGASSTVFMVDKFGRKFLFAASSLSVSICMFTMAGYFHLKSLSVDTSGVQWLPVTALSLCVYTYTVGLGSIPFILLADLLPNEVRSSATMLIMLVFNSNLFVILFSFGRVLDMLGPHPVFYLFGCITAISFISSLLIIPETKGKTTEQIMLQLSK